MVVALIAGSLLAELDRLLLTPLDAGEALFAVVQPGGSAFWKIDVSGRADILAGAAAVAFPVDPEASIHLGNVGKGKSVESGKKDILPPGAFLDQSFLPHRRCGGNPADLASRHRDPLDLLLFRSGATPRDVVGRHYQLKVRRKEIIPGPASVS